MPAESQGQIQLPDQFRSGDPLRAADLEKMNKALAFALKDMIAGGPGITVDQSAGRFIISALNKSIPAMPPGLLIYRTGETTPEFFSKSDIYAGYILDPVDPVDPEVEPDPNWSLEFAVSGGALVPFSTTPPKGVSSIELYDGDAYADPPVAQTFYRLPVVRRLTIGASDRILRYPISGIYRENIFCDLTKGPIVGLEQIA